MIIINKETIEKLNLHKDRYNNYLEHYSEFNGTVEEFLDLDKISYEVKIWVLSRLLTKEQSIKWSLLCTKSVLHIFENKYPNDLRPRKALEAVQNWLDNPNEVSRALLRMHAFKVATYTGDTNYDYDYAAYAAAYAAAAAAAAAYDYAAYAAAAAYDYAAYAAAAAAAYAADAAAADADADSEKQKQLNLDFLKQIINEIKK